MLFTLGIKVYKKGHSPFTSSLCDDSERAYGSVAYLHTDNGEEKVHVAFLAARSSVAPKKQLSIPRLELWWWLWFWRESSLLTTRRWCAGHIQLQYLAGYSQTYVGIRYLLFVLWPSDRVNQSDNTWCPTVQHISGIPEATTQSLHRAVDSTAQPTADVFLKAELALLGHAQMESFPEFTLIQSGKPIPASSRFLSLAPEYDETSDLMLVGGRLRRWDSLSQEILHPVLLTPSHPITKLLIQHCDDQLHHPGDEYVFAELCRKYWILRGKEAVRGIKRDCRHQHNCPECRKWKGQSEVPRMAYLPPSSFQALPTCLLFISVELLWRYAHQSGSTNWIVVGHPVQVSYHSSS